MDTKAFYTDEELAIDKKLEEHRGRRRQLKQVMLVLEQFYNQERTEKSALKRLRELKYCDKTLEQVPPHETIDELKSEIRNIAPVLNELKADMLALLNTFDGVRSYRPEYIQDKYVISIFESSLTRTLGIPTATLTKDLVVVKTCYFKILRDIILNGFIMDGERYVCLTASAGQLRTKRSVFIRESAWATHQNTIMCGLTIEHINEMGGINTNKFLAYLALCNSATDPWPEFDITKTIVVDDMETIVNGVVDFIDDKTYTIERKEMGVPITHTDGCGMVRLGVSRKNFMVRLPWVKGLLAAFPFDKFIREANKADPTVNHGIVKDIYGVEHDILAEDIQVILTKSQFKMAKYYQNWANYQQNFIKYGCEACICNEEPDIFDRAKINYQMLQTLTDLTDDELLEVSAETRRRLNNISSNKETMLQVFGATKTNPRRSPFQESLLIYPELLQDEYTRETLREIKKSIEKEARAGRLDIDGYYTFLIPDMYAFCQWLFLGQKEPTGLLDDGEVYCDLFEPGSELDCLRSPHLYIEHAIRTNMFGCDEERKRWFVTSGIYVSCHDLISKIIMCDWDGDKSLVVSNSAIINAAKRNLNGIVPLYYEMKKAGAKSITSEEIYNSMIAAYTGGNIGQISNDITKIWNGNVDSSAIDVVKLLCLENNFTIDFAKTLYKPERPEYVNELIRKFTKSSVPYFFVDAKDKTLAQVAHLNNSPVNRLRNLVPVRRLNFTAKNLGKFDPKMLMHNTLVPTNEISERIISVYQQYVHSVKNRFPTNEDGRAQSYWQCQRLIDALLEVHPDIYYIVDVLVKELFIKKHSKRKVLFWACFGNVVVENLRNNLGGHSAMCIHCGRRFYRESNRQQMCKACSDGQRKAMKAANERERRKKRGHLGNSL